MLTDAEGIETLYTTLAEQFEFPRAPRKDFRELAAQMPAIGATAGPGGDDGSIEVQMVTRDRDVRQRLRRALEMGHKRQDCHSIAPSCEGATTAGLVKRRSRGIFPAARGPG